MATKTTKTKFCYSDVPPAPTVNQGSPVRCAQNRGNMDSPKKSPQNSPADKATVKVSIRSIFVKLAVPLCRIQLNYTISRCNYLGQPPLTELRHFIGDRFVIFNCGPFLLQSSFSNILIRNTHLPLLLGLLGCRSDTKDCVIQFIKEKIQIAMLHYFISRFILLMVDLMQSDMEALSTLRASYPRSQRDCRPARGTTRVCTPCVYPDRLPAR